jgi:hypothetical protein
VQINRCQALVLDTPIVASQKKAKPGTVNLKMMFLAEALVLVFALAIAIVRGLAVAGRHRSAAWRSCTRISSAARR